MKSYKILNRIDSPSDLKQLELSELELLCEELRHFLIYNVSKTGGHLASNLGVVELTLAVHYVFDSPKDKIIFDVGHQCYTHKIITGRRDLFHTLRSKGGISGFTKPQESVHDSFIAGHSSTSLSAGLGMSTANFLNKNDGYTVCIVGDGAFTAGMIYEAMNNANRNGNSKLIVILNNNDMSISKNVGSVAKYISGIRSKSSYYKLKKGLGKTLDNTPIIGKSIKDTLVSSKNIIKDMIYHSNFFEDFGFHYIGPLNGHNLIELITTLEYSKKSSKPAFVHAETIKGKGYIYAEKNPQGYHGITKFNIESGNSDISSEDSFSTIAGKKIKKLADNNKDICAITAAMEYGTGLQYFREAHPDRFFDVGIAEQHALTFSVGLACNGKIPIFAVYSTFLQRAYDQFIHDAAIQNKKIVLCVDRAGVVGEDGETHQGIFDVSYMSCIPNVRIMSPSNYQELELCIDQAVNNIESGVVVVRYPRGNDDGSSKLYPVNYLYNYVGDGDDLLIVTYGRISKNILQALEELKSNNINVSFLKLISIKPIPDEVIDIASSFENIVFYEEGIESGGIGQQLFYKIHINGFRGKYKIISINDEFISQASVENIFNQLGFDKDSVVRYIKSFIGRYVYDQ